MVTEWLPFRRQSGWQLQRNKAGMARVVDPVGRFGPQTSYSEALMAFRGQTQHALKCSPKGAAILVHGMLGETETFPEISAIFDAPAWSVEHFRYPTAVARFDHHVRRLGSMLARLIDRSPQICLIGHSFGCRLIADALLAQNVPRCDVVFIAPPVDQIRWAKRGTTIPPVRNFLGGSLADMAERSLNQRALMSQRLLVIAGGRRGVGDGWLHEDETQLHASHQRCVVGAGHSSLTRHPDTCREIARFLGL